MSNYSVIPLKVPADCCIPGDCQGVVDLVAGYIEVNAVNEAKQIHYGTIPDRQDIPWVNIDDGFLYTPDTSRSVWKRPYWPPPSSAMQLLWTDTKEALWSFDGGNGMDPGVPGQTDAYTGSFWKIDPRMEGRSPIGAGYIGGDTNGTNLQVNNSYGNAATLLTASHIPDHPHTLHIQGTHEGLPPNDPWGLQPGPLWDPQTPDPIEMAPSGGADPQSPVDIVHPVYAVYFAIRTVRRWYTIPF